MVGQRFISLLENHPWFEVVTVAASPRSAGKTYEEAVGGRWKMDTPMPEGVKKLIVKNVNEVEEVASTVDFVFSAVDMTKDEIKAIEEAYAKTETPVVSNNSAHRWTKDVPMVVPEINAAHFDLIKTQKERLGTTRGFIAVKPNCSIQSYTPALAAWKEFGPKEVVVTTYQAISGAGKTFKDWPEMIENIIPYIGGEEEKSEKEPLRVLGTLENGEIKLAEEPKITCQCLRVPVLNGHTAAVFINFEKKPTKEQLIEKLEMGAASMVVASPGFMTAIGVPEVDIFSLEYLFDSFDHWEKCLDGEFGDKMKDVVKEKTGNNFRIMAYWSSSVRDYYGKKPVTKPEDLKGMTIRTQSSQVQQDFWKVCGAIPTSVAWGELYQALQQGVVDSAENDYTSFMLKEHHKTPNGHYISETHHDYTTRLLLMNGAFYDGLTDEQKGWIDEAVEACTEEERQVVYRMFKESKEKVIADGAEVTNFEDVDIDAFKALALPIQDKFAADNNMTAELEMIRAAAE